MLKVVGSILVIGGTTLMGMRKAKELKEQYIQMENLRQLFYRLQSEIRYARTPLGEIFSHIGSYAKEPYRTWFLKLGKRMEERNGGVFDELWKTSIQENLGCCGLPEAELLRLEELGGRLGLTDVTLQVKTLELYLMQLSEAMEEARENMKTKVRLCRCLGVMSGLFIVTLLL